jgi:hypothetical protein
MTIGDIQTKIYDLTKTNSASYPNANMLIDINVAYNRIASLIIQAEGRWQWDDDNQSASDQGGGLGGQQNGTTALVANQQDYSFPVTYLKLLRVELKPNNGQFFYKLFPRDVDDPMYGSTMGGVDDVSVGTPRWYDVTGHSVFLYPIPNYSQNASLRFYFQRGGIDFTSADLSTGTKVPGFASLFHDLIAYLVAKDYVRINQPNLFTGYALAVQEKEAELQKYYATRQHDDVARLSMSQIHFR